MKRVPASNELHIVNPSKKYKAAYPLSTFTYAIVPKVTSKKFLLGQFLLYAMRQGQKFGAALDWRRSPRSSTRQGSRPSGSSRASTAAVLSAPGPVRGWSPRRPCAFIA